MLQDLRGLVYPLVQIVTGAIRLVPTPRYFPLRLRLLRSLNRLSSATGLFVPVAPLLLEMLQWRGLHTAVKSGGGPQMQTTPQLRAGKQLLATATFQQSLVDEVRISRPSAQNLPSAILPEASKFPDPRPKPPVCVTYEQAWRKLAFRAMGSGH